MSDDALAADEIAQVCAVMRLTLETMRADLIDLPDQPVSDTDDLTKSVAVLISQVDRLAKISNSLKGR